MSTFSYSPDFGTSKSSKPSVSTVQFGDGYMTRVTKGLNPISRAWQLRFENRDPDEIDEIEAFFEARGGTEAFEWTPLREDDPVNVICMEWSRSTEHGNADSLTCVFTQVYEP